MTTLDKNYVTEVLATFAGTEGNLLIPKKIADTLLEDVNKELIPRSEAAMYFGPTQIPGSSIDVDIVGLDSGDVRLVGEGAELPIDNATYSSTNIKPLKYGVAIRITRELMEDAKWNLLQHNIGLMGRRFAENENALIVTQLDSAANTVSGGATVTIANITRACQYLEDSDLRPSTIAIGKEVLNDFRNIDTFVEYDKVGNREMLESGYIGTVYGLKVITVSTNAGMTTTTAYVFDRNHAYAIAEKRTVTVENFKLETYDMEGAAVTQRIAAKILRTAAVAKITSS